MRYNVNILTEGCKSLGIQLSENQIEQFLLYYECLIEKNKVMNLTTITEFDEVVVKHFIDSVSLVKAVSMEKITRILDLGTGAGFPGIPLKIVFPDKELVLLDSLNKRILFLQEIIEKCRFNKITAVHGRAEDMARKPGYRESFDLCVSRAVANLSSLSEYCLPFVTCGGQFISYKSNNIDKELESASNAIQMLGGGKAEKIDFLLPGTEIGRSFVIIEKVKETPGKYPRKAGIPSREPL